MARSKRSDYLKLKNRELFILPPGHISVILLFNSGSVPIADTKVVLVRTNERLEGKTDKDGLVTFDKLPIDEYKLELPELDASVVVSSTPTDVEKVPVCVAGYELFGKEPADPPGTEQEEDPESSEMISQQADDRGWQRAGR